MRELMAAGGGYCCGPPQIKRESLSVGVSTVLEHTERAVNRSRMVSLSRVDKKSVRDNNSNKNKNVSPNILGRPLIYLGGPPR